MKKKIIQLSLTGLLFLTVFSFGFSQQEQSTDWPQFRGLDRSGSSNELLGQQDWTVNEPELLWRKEIGSGFSELAISNGSIYTLASHQIDSTSGFEYLVAFNEISGEELWRTQIDSLFIDVDGWGNGPRSTPSIDEESVYCLSGLGKLSSHSRENGQINWQIDFRKEFGSEEPRWGFSTSPVIIGDTLIIEAGGTESRAFIAFNKNDGSMIWSNADGPTSYDSPLLATIDGVQQIIFVNSRKMYSFNSAGDTLWTYQMPMSSLMAMPVLIDDDKVFVSGVRSTGFIILKIEKDKASEIIHGNSMKNDFNSCTYLDGYLYGFHVAALRCISAETGEVKWTKRGFGKGSLIRVDNKLLVLSDKGKLILVEATPDAYMEKGFVLAIHGKSWTAPSFSNGKIYVRNLTEMACFKLK